LGWFVRSSHIFGNALILTVVSGSCRLSAGNDLCVVPIQFYTNELVVRTHDLDSTGWAAAGDGRGERICRCRDAESEAEADSGIGPKVSRITKTGHCVSGGQIAFQ